MSARRPSVLGRAAVLFGIMVAHTMLETARDALFLVRLGPERLVWAYLAIAGTALVAVAAVRRWGGARDPRRMLIGFLVLATTGTAALAIALALAPSIVFVLYVWTGLVATLVVPAFWTLIEGSLGIGDAKKQFSVIAAGGVVGALVGSSAATAIGWLAGPVLLVWAGAGVLGATTALAAVRSASVVHAAAVSARMSRAVTRSAQSRRYLRVILIAALLSTITLTLADLAFKQLLAEHVDGGSLATVFGAIYAGFNLIGLVIQLLITPRLFARLGVGATLTILPVLVIATALGFVLTGSVIAIVALKLSDGGLRHSIYRVAGEILFLPVPHALRDAAKPVMEAIGTRGGQAIAALVALAIASGGIWWLGVATVVAGLAWLVAIAVTRNRYVEQFRDTLEAGDIQRDVKMPTLDNNSISLLTQSLSSPDEDEARAALDLLARRGDRVPALVLYHPSSAVVRRALALLEGDVRPDVERVLRHLTSHADPEIRAAAIGAAVRTGTLADRLCESLADAEPEVRAAAAVAAFHANRVSCHALDELLAATAVERAAIARAIARHPDPVFRPLLDQLIARREPEVTREVLRVWQRAPELADPDRLLGLLEDPKVRGEVRRVIEADGARYFDRLLGALEDPRTPLGVRRHLPRTISRFNSPAAATALVARLLREPDGTTEFKLLRALGRMRVTNPTLPVDPEAMLVYARRSLGDAERYARFSSQIGHAFVDDSDPGIGLLRELLAEKRRHALERVFRALGVIHPRAELRSVHDGLTGDDGDRLAAAREVLEGLLPSAIRIPLLAALCDATPHPKITGDELVAALLADPSDAIRCIAAHHVAERRLTALRPELARLRPYASAMVGHAFDQAIARLDA